MTALCKTTPPPELIEEVKKLVIGRPRHGLVDPVPHDHPKTYQDLVSASYLLINLELLPGGKYLAAILDTRIELWSVVTRAVIWCLPARWPRYTFELLEYADTALCALGTIESPETVKVLSIDLSSGESTEVFTIDLPDGTLLADRPMLCDGFLLCQLLDVAPRQDPISLLVHWHENQAVVLRPYLSVNVMKLLPGHIVFTGSHASHSTRIHVCALESFSGMWQPATSVRLARSGVDLRDMPAVATQELPSSTFAVH
ncbi:hypothetical protein C8J57DRAFT_1667059 [Mycena rebaudengoi]|nr:hypothetical protein C8J57DRAFT_1667059 [Mycena rebaudengoi]